MDLKISIDIAINGVSIQTISAIVTIVYSIWTIHSRQNHLKYQG
ncbi:hypothetical protein R9X47_08675 [Wukongibacter baidiensis]